MSDKKVILYSQPTCAPCQEAKVFMTNADIPFEVRDIRENPKYLEEVIELGASMTPVIVMGDTVFMGFDGEQLQVEWDKYANA